MKQRKLGNQGLYVPQIGLGCMGMSTFAGMDIYGQADENNSIKTIHRSLELGGNFLDTADAYGPFLNEKLIAKAIKGKRDQFVIASKFGIEINDSNEITWAVNGKKDYVKKSIERSLKHLNTDYIDLYYLHRMDKSIPIEETVEAMAELVKEGKIGHIGLSEVSSETIQRAHAIHPITAVQTEYSLFERSVEQRGIINTLNELNIGLVAYSPLGRGFLSGQFKSPEDFPENDFRRGLPKFQGDQFNKNIELLNEIEIMAAEKGITSSQLAIAWTIAKGALPIPGTKQLHYLEQNIAAANYKLSTDDLNRLERIIPLSTETGNRYDDAGMSQVD